MRQAGGREHQQLLGHAHLVEAVGIGLGEDVQVGVLRRGRRSCRRSRGGSCASSTSAWPNGAGLVRCPSPAIEAIIAEVVSRGLFGSWLGATPVTGRAWCGS